VMKYHAYTGLPIWATTMPNVDAIVTMADGRLFAAGEGSGAQFDSVYTPNTARYWGWYAELDAATGKGKSVKAFGGTSSTYIYDAASTPGGDLLLAGYSGSTSIFMDEGFTLTYPEENQENQFMLTKVETSGTKAAPSCITSTTTCEIDANFCYIDGQCHADGVTADIIGRSCKVCDPSKSQTSWSDAPSLGVTQCFIDGDCVEGEHSGNAAGTPTYHTGVRAATGYVYGASECRYCDPAKSITEWSVKDGYTYTGESLPDDCLADDTTDTTDSGDSTDTTTQTGGGTLSESDGAQALVAGALAPLAALLL